jgi:O-antigen ligase
VGYGVHHLTRDLALMTVLVAYAMLSLASAYASGGWGLPVLRLTAALAALGVTTLVGVLHGVAAGNSLRFIGLELFPLLGFGAAVGLGGLPFESSRLRTATWVLTVAALCNAAIGFADFAITHTRSGGTAFSPIPGLAALLILNRSLHDPERYPRLSSVLLIGVLVLHQILSFTRGYWLGLIVGVIGSCVLYGRRGAGARQRWSKVGRTIVLAALLTTAGLAAAVVRLGWSDVSAMLGARFASGFETRVTQGSVSNIARLIELKTSLRLIRVSPWFGYGHGFTLVPDRTLLPIDRPRAWWVHESYIMIWLKQGILGVVSLLWVLFAAVRLGVKGLSHPDPRAAGWCGAAAVCTLSTSVIALTNYTYFLVNQTFFLAALWGIALSAHEPRRRRLGWRGNSLAPVAARPPGAP